MFSSTVIGVCAARSICTMTDTGALLSGIGELIRTENSGKSSGLSSISIAIDFCSPATDERPTVNLAVSVTSNRSSSTAMTATFTVPPAAGRVIVPVDSLLKSQSSAPLVVTSETTAGKATSGAPGATAPVGAPVISISTTSPSSTVASPRTNVKAPTSTAAGALAATGALTAVVSPPATSATTRSWMLVLLIPRTTAPVVPPPGALDLPTADIVDVPTDKVLTTVAPGSRFDLQWTVRRSTARPS